MSTATATVPTPAKAPAVKPRGPKFRWKLTRGIYIEDNPAAHMRDASGEIIRRGNRIRTAGEVIETDEDLGAAFNAPGYPAKFEKLDEADGARRLPGETKAQYKDRLNDLVSKQKQGFADYFQNINLDEMSLDDVVAFAQVEGFDIGKVKQDRESIVKSVRAQVEQLLKE